jgi:branched-chain amino acid transport system substrate-binding protein
MQAWASSVNAAGGINGHPVSVVVEDDANSPTQAALAGKKIIAAKVQAVVDASAQDPGFAKELAAAGIPVTGGIAYSAPMFTNPNFFPSGAVIPNVLMGQVIEAKANGKSHMGLPYCKETPACAQLVGLVAAAGSVVGGFKVTGVAVSFTQPSYVPACLTMKGAGVDNLFSAVIAPVVVRIAQDCAQQGFKPLQVNQATTSAASWTKASPMFGTVLADAQAPWFATSIPAVKAFTDAVNKYAPGVTTDPGFGPDDLSPWTGGVLFQAAAKAGNLTPSSTPADVRAALYKLHNETLGGLSGPLNYTPGKPAFPACYFVAGVESGKFTTPKGTNYICPTPAQVKGLGTILAKLG